MGTVKFKGKNKSGRGLQIRYRVHKGLTNSSEEKIGVMGKASSEHT